ncbi:MAG: RNA polymerase sigma factor FliA [Gammaproteobacteria bacterium]
MRASTPYADAGAMSPDLLIERHAPLVKRIAVHMLGRLPRGIELDDLVQVGLIALLDAARQYSPDKGAAFETYASIRIRGAILDEVRSNDWAPRSVYRKQRQLSAAMQTVENRSGEHASAKQVAKELGVTLEQYFRMLSDTTSARMFSLEQTRSDSEAPIERLTDTDSDPSVELESEQFRQEMIDSIKLLPEREALVMSLYYEEELNLKEIGNVLGVSESRVCQIHGQALVRLRARLQEWIEARQKGF